MGKNHTIKIDEMKNLKLISRSGGKWSKPALAATKPSPHDKGTNKAIDKSFAFIELNFYGLFYLYINFVFE